MINFNSQKIFINGKNIQLTFIEYKIIELLCKNAGKVLIYDYIQKYINGPYI
jgi:two-component system KDP operon response regulator KdpE